MQKSITKLEHIKKPEPMPKQERKHVTTLYLSDSTKELIKAKKQKYNMSTDLLLNSILKQI